MFILKALDKAVRHNMNFVSKLVEHHTSYLQKQMKICLWGEKKYSLSATDKELE